MEKCRCHKTKLCRFSTCGLFEHLIKFGNESAFELLLSFKNYSNLTYTGRLMRHLLHPPTRDSRYLEPMTHNSNLELVTDNRYLDFDRAVMTYDPTLSKRRILILHKVLEIVAMKRVGNDEIYDHRECIKETCRALSEPFITTKEIEKFLCSLLQDDALNGLVKSICLQFERDFLICQPRTLSELTVCVIHRSLGKAATTLHGMKQLRIPKKLKKLILIEEDCATHT